MPPSLQTGLTDRHGIQYPPTCWPCWWPCRARRSNATRAHA